jgi:hypothetical protein
MPNKDTILINGEHVAKRHLLTSKFEAYRSFKKANPEFPRKFTTFFRMIPKNIKALNLSYRQVCVCIKDYNLEQKVDALNKLAISLNIERSSTLRQLSDMTVCKYEAFPERKCCDRLCERCGTMVITEWYEPLVSIYNNKHVVQFNQWETINEKYEDKKGNMKDSKRWVQRVKRIKVSDAVEEVKTAIESFTSHIFRSDYQQRMQNNIISDLPIDHCLVVMDFSENLSLKPQDEIESAHWNIKQVTIHPIFIARHSPNSTVENPVTQKESLIMISDSLEHDTGAV